MSVWLVLPSALPPEQADECFKLWSQQGYKLCIQRDPGHIYDSQYAHIMMERPYKGYPEAVNYLAKGVLADDLDCNWIVAAGDDTHPDLSHTADEIADELTEFFHGTFGVCQPTGDRWSDHMGAIIERIAGSPWMGREWCERANQGRGPMWPEFFHNWADQFLQETAIKYGRFARRRDLIHYHNHSRRKGGQWKDHQRKFDADYVKMKPLFEALKAAGFPGSEPL